jgi:FixJ family two-component response regulator
MSQGTCVFVVDDDPSARNGLARLLRTAGYEVRDFASANEFLGALDPQCALDPDTSGCLILDARMPGLTGKELMAELKTRGVCLPIIMVTAEDDLLTRKTAQAMNASAFFRKPVDGTALLDAIDWALRSGRGSRVSNNE